MRDQTRCKVSSLPIGHSASLSITARVWLDPQEMTSDLTRRNNQVDCCPYAENGDANSVARVSRHGSRT